MDAAYQPKVIEVGKLRMDRSRFEVTLRKVEVRLTRKEFELLWALASEPDRVFHRDELIDRVWGPDAFIHSRAVDVHVARLRRKLKIVPDLPLIETFRGIGYCLKHWTRHTAP